MISRASALLLIAACCVPAAAQSGGGYDPSRTCRFYVMQHLPVPVRCMAELLGNWSGKPYLDGEFMFRNRNDWLSWRDREDYRHWKNHDFGFAQNAAAQAVNAPIAAPPDAQSPPPTSAQASASLLCPAELAARIVLDRAALAGWTGTDGLALLRRDPANPPRAEAGTLSCFYVLGHDKVAITRPAWGRCVPRADAAGFDCTP